MSGLNKRKILMYTNIGLVFFYVVLIAYIAYEYIDFSNHYVETQANYVLDLNQQIEQLIQDPYNIDEEKILALRAETPFELILQDKDTFLFRTLNLEYSNSYIQTINPSLLAYEHQGFSQQNEVMKWSAIYSLSDSQFTEMFLSKQNIIFGLMFLLLLTFIFIIQYFMFRPITIMTRSLKKASEDGLVPIEIQQEDNLNRNLASFMGNIKDQMDVFSQEYSELEIELQFEKERLNNIFLLSKALVHDLKSPIHAIMLENELFSKRNKTNSGVETITHLTTGRIDTILQELNMTLRVMNDSYLTSTQREDFDVAEVIQQTIRVLHSMIENQQLKVNTQIPTPLVIQQNIIYFKLLIHNLLSNTFQYANKNTDVNINIEINNTHLCIQIHNYANKDNLKQMQLSQNIFHSIPNNKYSSGHGLFLIKDITALMNGKYTIEIQKDSVLTNVSIPIGDTI